MSDSLVLLLAAAMFIGVPCVIALGAVLIVGVMLWRFGEGARLLQLETFDQAAQDLLPWGPESFADLAAEWNGGYVAVPERFSASGRCLSLREPQRALSAFALKQEWGKPGVLLART